MKTYIKYLTSLFLKSFLNIFLIMMSLVFILNILKEIEFFNNMDVNPLYPVYLSLLSSPSIIFEMFPFIFLISTQFFFIKLFENDEIQIFKYTGLRNISILKVLSLLVFVMGLVIITLYYNFSSGLQSYYLQLKNQYTKNNEYLAVINKNGLWIKDIIHNEIAIINSSKINKNFLTNSYITRFDKNYNPIESIKSDKIDIKTKRWIIYDAQVFKENTRMNLAVLEFDSNFDLERIKSMFSNLSSLSLLELIDLNKNYRSLNYSTTDVEIQIQKIVSFPIYLVVMTILSAVIMFNTKKFKRTTFKVAIGLFFSVIIYYINNFFNVLGASERLPVISSVWIPLVSLIFINIIILYKFNEK
jgi:lipopolysaccharide export system permease protein